MSDVTDGLRQLHATLKRIELNRCFQAIDEISRLSSEGSGYRRALEYIADKDSLDDPRDVAQRTLDAYGEPVSTGLKQND